MTPQVTAVLATLALARAARRRRHGSLRAKGRRERQRRQHGRDLGSHAGRLPGSCTSCQSEYFSRAMNINSPVPVGVLGASGYVGKELLRLLAGHPRASVAFGTAETAAGEREQGVELLRIADAPIASAEVVFSALPHGVSAQYVQEARALGKRTVDLSADFRLSPEAVYGLPEVTRSPVGTAELVAAAGCSPPAAAV